MASVTRETTVKPKQKDPVSKGPSRAPKKPTKPSSQEKKNLEDLIAHDKNRRNIFKGKK